MITIRESLIARKKLSTDDILYNNDEYSIKSVMESLITVPSGMLQRMKNDNKKEWLTVYPPKTKENKTDYVIIYINKEYLNNTRHNKTMANLIDINIDRWNQLDFPKKITFVSIKGFNKKLEFNDYLSISFNNFKHCNLEGYEFYSDCKNGDPLTWVINGDNQTIKNVKFAGNKFQRMYLLSVDNKMDLNKCILSSPSTMNYIIENEVDYQYNITQKYNKVQKILGTNVEVTGKTNTFDVHYGIVKNNDDNYIENMKYTDEVYNKKWAIEDELKDIYSQNNIKIKAHFIINN